MSDVVVVGTMDDSAIVSGPFIKYRMMSGMAEAGNDTRAWRVPLERRAGARYTEPSLHFSTSDGNDEAGAETEE